MGDFEVYQDSITQMFNANSLLKQWNTSKGLKRGKEVNGFLKLDKTIEFIQALKDDYNDNTRKVVLIKKGKNGGTWFDPLLFIDFAMWINPTFKIQVLKFVYDELIKNRHEAGDTYKIISASGTKLKGYNFSEIATALQWIVFNKTGKGLRQSATKEELKELVDIQTKLAFSIDMGYIKTYTQLIKEIRKIYRLKYNTKQVA